MNIRRTQPWALGLLAAAVLTVAPSSASAVPLAPGTIVVPVAGVFDTSDLVNSVFHTFSAGSLSGTIAAAVYRQPGTGFLDFYYQVQNTSTVGLPQITRITNSNFANGYTFSTDVYYRLDGSTCCAQNINGNPSADFVDGDSPPITADRSVDGEVVGFDFDPPSLTTIGPGEESFTLVIRTDALYYEGGLTSVINGTTITRPTFAPSAVPEPGSLMLLGTGLLGLARAVRRRRTTEAAV